MGPLLMSMQYCSGWREFWFFRIWRTQLALVMSCCSCRDVPMLFFVVFFCADCCCFVGSGDSVTSIALCPSLGLGVALSSWFRICGLRVDAHALVFWE